MSTTKIFDLIGIGIGPFNLSLAVMLEDHPNINAIFIEQKPSFNWHPGLLLPWARLQVPYFADMVTLANPKSKFTYINYLHVTGQLFRFGAQENIFPLRIEYNNYCKWVAAQLPNLKFNHRCEKITYDMENDTYTIHCSGKDLCNKTFHAKRLVIGVGTVPYIPGGIKIGSKIVHSCSYLYHKSEMLKSKNITIIGSGQSAAEIYYDLLQHADHLKTLQWFTRSRNIAPMDYSRFALEMAMPDYVEYFYNLPKETKKQILSTQTYLYKGINQQLITQIHDALHMLYASDHPLVTRVHTGTEITNAQQLQNDSLKLTFLHRDTKCQIDHQTNFLILATGYHTVIPAFLELIKNRINWDRHSQYEISKYYTIDKAESIFVQNADLHSHGFNAADLGMGQHRNMIIINQILNKEYYKIEHNTTVQSFHPLIG